eukprot:3190260-Pyramimonas_sp.AAC.1
MASLIKGLTSVLDPTQDMSASLAASKPSARLYAEKYAKWSEEYGQAETTPDFSGDLCGQVERGVRGVGGRSKRLGLSYPTAVISAAHSR